ncbi:phosphoglycerate mutase family protein [Flavobacterium sp.]|uniref:SixA phosphatase family protein n=1 Tax=Flavobacterium sp. TaxID=239 RepID=UPI0028BD7595|nr:phosphoglycerate mutase family protein [Flavobacterium sp.]
MKNLVLIRHAKSNWDIPLNDIDRPLSKRGIGDAHITSHHIDSYLPKTFIVWSSPARRAKETAMIYAQNLAIPLETIIYKDDLYTFDEKGLEQAIKNCENKYDSLILFGHNGAITDFVNKFGDRYIDNVPTSGVVSLTFEENDWSAIRKGKIKDAVFPSHLKS